MKQWVSVSGVKRLGEGMLLLSFSVQVGKHWLDLKGFRFNTETCKLSPPSDKNNHGIVSFAAMPK
jgi:hypothetical protein